MLKFACSMLEKVKYILSNGGLMAIYPSKKIKDTLNKSKYSEGHFNLSTKQSFTKS